MKHILSFIMICVACLFVVNSASAFVIEPAPDDPMEFLDSSFYFSGGAAIDTDDDALIFDEMYSYDNMYVYNYSYYVDAQTLSFDYYFAIAPGNTDFLIFDINYDNEMPVFEIGSNNTDGIDYTIFEGSFSVDLRPYAGETVSLVFGFEWDDEYIGSYGEITNVEVSSVPVPAAIILLGSALISLAGMRKKIRS